MDTQGKTGNYGKHYTVAEKQKILQAVRATNVKTAAEQFDVSPKSFTERIEQDGLSAQ